MKENISRDFNTEYLKIRRAKKAITDEAWIKAFLLRSAAGVLATIYQDQPFISPKLFVYDEEQHALYLHSANEGRVWDNVHLNPKASFTTYAMGRIIPAEKARGFGVEYESVVVFGTLSIMEGKREMIAALQLFMDKYAPHLQYGKDYAAITDHDLDGLAIYRLEIAGWSAKQDKANPEQPGAYRYEDFVKS